jgi:hypothetical protein
MVSGVVVVGEPGWVAEFMVGGGWNSERFRGRLLPCSHRSGIPMVARRIGCNGH